MSIHPVLLDGRPDFFAGSDECSLLLLPTGRRTIGGRLVDQLRALTDVKPLVVPRFGVTASYANALREACPTATIEVSFDALLERVATLDPAEELLLIDPLCWPRDGFSAEVTAHLRGSDRGMARHLVLLERSSGQTREYVQADSDGRLRKIQRYYHPQTWPFSRGIACSVIPVACLLTTRLSGITSLDELRRALSAHGVPTRDIPFPEGGFDLSGEEGVLQLVERLTREAVAGDEGNAASPGRQSLHAGGARIIASSARLVGPVIVEEGAIIEAGALIVGPALLGAGCTIGAGAVVAQSLVLRGARVPTGGVARHRVVAGLTTRGRTPDHARAVDAPRVGASHSRSIVELSEPTVRRTRPYEMVKRAIEFSAALVGLTLISPLLVLIALAVKVFSPGPLFFGHEREGKGGRVFRCWKFRTMRVGADAIQRELAAQQQLDGPQFKMDRDPRVTTIGRFLRASSLDELPQLWNVLVGDMSLVGPRPSPFRENQICVPWRQGRLSVRPGITGLWQVCRHDRANGDFHQWIEYDLLYVRHMSARVDLAILVATVNMVLFRRPAALSRIIPGTDSVADVVAGTMDESELAIAEAHYGSPRAATATVRAAARLAILVAALLLPLRASRAQDALARPRLRRGWAAAMTALLGWDSNPRFTPTADTADMVSTVRVATEGVWGTSRTDARLTLGAGLLAHRTLSSLDRTTYDGSAAVSRLLSPRATGSASATARSELTRDAAIEPGALAAGALAMMRTQAATADLAYALSRRETLGIGARYSRVTFDSPLLAPGSAAGARLALTRRAGERGAWGLDWEEYATRSGSRSLLRGVGQLVGERVLSTRVSARAGAGVTSLMPTGDSTAGMRSWLVPTGSAELAVVEERSRGAIRYERSASQLVGAREVAATDFFAIRGDRRIGRTLRVEAGGEYSRSHDLNEVVPRRSASRALAGVHWVTPSGVALGVSAYRRSRLLGQYAASYGVSVSMGLVARDWPTGMVPGGIETP